MPKAGFRFNVHKQPVPESSGVFLAKKPHLSTRTESHQVGKKAAREVSASFPNSRKKGSHGHNIPDVLESSISSSSSPSVVQVGTLPNFYIIEEHYFQQVCA